MKRTFTSMVQRWEREAVRRPDRAVPALDVPSLAELGQEHLLRDQRPLAGAAIGTVFIGLGVMLYGMVAGLVWIVALAAWLVYGGAVLTIHQLIHSSLGLTPQWRRRWLTVVAGIVLESGHALQAAHLLHHRTEPDVPDPEGFIEHVPWRHLPTAALSFRYRMMAWGLMHGARPRRIRGEVAWHVGTHVVALALLPFTIYPALYLVTMMISAWAFAVLSSKGPQANFGRPISSPLVMVRSRVMRVLFFAHDHHIEHHAYPKVPMVRLRKLAPAVRPYLERQVGADGSVLRPVEIRLP